MRSIGLWFGFASLLTVGCGSRDSGPAEPREHLAETWSVTAWGVQFEIFAEADPLIAGKTVVSNTHVTVLSDFSPLREGTVRAVLRPKDGQETVFSQEKAARDGIFRIDVTPQAEGEYELFFRVEAPRGIEEIPAGGVRVGTADAPGGAVEPLHDHPPASVRSGQPVTFLKEQQWKTEFATTWIVPGSLRRSVKGPARVRPAGGAEAVLTAPVDGVVLTDPWPYLGQERRRGATLFRLQPRVAGASSLAELESVATEVETELVLARDRLARLEQLLVLDAVARSEVEAARARVVALEARSSAARRDLATARSARTGRGPRGEAIDIATPVGGQVASLAVTPGQAVSAGEVLGRVVGTDPVWVEVALRPEDVQAVDERPHALIVYPAGAASDLRFEGERVRLVSVAPEVDRATGSVAAIFEVRGASAAGLRPGVTARAEILLQETIQGTVIPESALVDDSGILVVYLQEDGEHLARQEVRVIARQGNEVLVEGLEPGERLVVRGGAAIRRASLLSSGTVEGHVH